MWDIKTIILDFIKTRNLQKFLNNRFKSETKIVIPKNCFKYVGTDYALFHMDYRNIEMINQVETEYNYDDFRNTDIVLDVGANIGAFSLKICGRVKHVYAIEPIIVDSLKNNIILNNVKNITVFDYALGNGLQKIEWLENSKDMECISLSELIIKCGGKIDILKCDCEGGEWCIIEDDLKKIRRVEMELHLFNNENKNDFLKILYHAGFKIEICFRNKKTLLIHAYK